MPAILSQAVAAAKDAAQLTTRQHLETRATVTRGRHPTQVIIGVVISALAGLAFLIVVCIILRRRQRRVAYAQHVHSPHMNKFAGSNRTSVSTHPGPYQAGNMNHPPPAYQNDPYQHQDKFPYRYEGYNNGGVTAMPPAHTAQHHDGVIR